MNSIFTIKTLSEIYFLYWERYVENNMSDYFSIVYVKNNPCILSFIWNITLSYTAYSYFFKQEQERHQPPTSSLLLSPALPLLFSLSVEEIANVFDKLQK